jgi:hypothetical protein
MYMYCILLLIFEIQPGSCLELPLGDNLKVTLALFAAVAYQRYDNTLETLSDHLD